MGKALSELHDALARRIAIDSPSDADMTTAINIALEEVGKITKVDDTSLTVVNNQTEYSLPSGVYDVVRIEVANSKSADYDYQINYSWRVIGDKLYLPDALDYSSGNKIRIYYNDTHDALSADTDTISDFIPEPLLLATAAYHYHLNRYADEMNMGTKDAEILAAKREDMYMARDRYSVRHLDRDPILGSN